MRWRPLLRAPARPEPESRRTRHAHDHPVRRTPVRPAGPGPRGLRQRRRVPTAGRREHDHHAEPGPGAQRHRPVGQGRRQRDDRRLRHPVQQTPARTSTSSAPRRPSTR
ncbi:hypothetical protein G5V59_17740 [Nocardioides sp. W3-2-3]|uniref:hypothetical protein n=1 Tax=Nocardioides convexus TaxID=2712224 RepID=UPI0024189674|nr:hypothetical protein [Nocardioides convexus]NHA01100.1 hypothetical protein [Nocardioides convexus]